MDNFTISTPSDLEKMIFPKEDEHTLSKEHLYTLHISSKSEEVTPIRTEVLALDPHTTSVRCVIPEGEMQVPLSTFIAHVKRELLSDIARQTRLQGVLMGL